MVGRGRGTCMSNPAAARLDGLMLIRCRLKLKLYRSLGIDVEPDVDGRYTKAVVRDARRGTASVVEIDPEAEGSFDSNRFWGVM